MDIQWKYSKDSQVILNDRKRAQQHTILGKVSGLLLDKDTSYLDDGDDGDINDGDMEAAVDDGTGGGESSAAPMSAVDAKKAEEDRKAQEEERKKQVGAVEIKDGDYQVRNIPVKNHTMNSRICYQNQIQVHVIEARELKAENHDGSSDPVVEVECFGKKQHTRTIKGQLNCVFDEVLIFNMAKLAKETFEVIYLNNVIRVCEGLFLRLSSLQGWNYQSGMQRCKFYSNSWEDNDWLIYLRCHSCLLRKKPRNVPSMGCFDG